MHTPLPTHYYSGRKNLASFIGKVFLVLMLFFGLGQASAENRTPSPTQNPLLLTHFMFTQVIQSFIEDGDRFIIE